MPSRIHVAVAGAQTAVGREIIRALEERDIPASAITALAPEGSAESEDGERELLPLTRDRFQGADLAFFAGDSKLSSAFVPAALEAGAYCIDLSKAFRSDVAVPLCAPPVSPFVRSEKRIAACPDALAIAVARAVAPLRGKNVPRRISVTSLHSVSTRGVSAVRELERQVAALMNARGSEPKVFKHRVAFNAFPEVGSPEGIEFADEVGLETELPRLLDLKDLAVGATCVRVPIFHGNAASVTCAASEPIDAPALVAALAASPSVKLLDQPEEHVYPTTQLAVGDDAVLIGRVRPDRAFAGGISLFVTYDPIRLAALNAVQVADEFIRG